MKKSSSVCTCETVECGCGVWPAHKRSDRRLRACSGASRASKTKPVKQVKMLSPIYTYEVDVSGRSDW